MKVAHAIWKYASLRMGAGVLLFLVLAAIALAGDRICGYCNRVISGQYVEAEGVYYHPEHFLCAQCNRPINGDYVSYQGKNYHHRCYKLHVALRCSLCGQVIDGEYIYDYWGNAYHAWHQGKTPQCEYCNRFISEELTGGSATYRDGRTVCGICRRSAVTSEHRAQLLMEEVAGLLGKFGMSVDTEHLKLHLLDLDGIKEKTGQYHSLQGYADYRETSRLFGLVREHDINVYVLWGMPEAEVISTLAHELTHVWQFRHGRTDNDPALCEGSSNLAAYLVCRQYADPYFAYVIEKLQKNNDPVYGEGFRRVKRLADDSGITNWLTWLAEHDRLPQGY
jgi:hypothetical protein